MATLEQEQSERKTLKSLMDQLIAIDPNQPVRADVLGKELSFESGLPVFQQTLGLFNDLPQCSLDSVPFETLHS